MALSNSLWQCLGHWLPKLSRNLDDSDAAGISEVADESQVPKSIFLPSLEHVPSAVDIAHSKRASDIIPLGSIDEVIPGLDLSSHSGDFFAPSVGSIHTEDMKQEQVASAVGAPVDLLSSGSTDIVEELSPKGAVMDISNSNFSTATSVGLNVQLILPKISAPVVNLSDEQENVQKQAFVMHN